MITRAQLTAGIVLLTIGALVGVTVSATGAADTPTFTKDVAPILYNRCVSCHRPGQIAPMSFMTYEETRPWARAIRDAVATRTMPPWHADPRYGRFENDPSLSQQEIDTIVTWAAAGAPKGDDQHLPPRPSFTEGWTIGEPDLVLTMQEGFDVPATGVVPYLYFTIPTKLTEDRWVQAVEIKPGNRSVVHHAIAFVAPAAGAVPREGPAPAFLISGQLSGITPNRTGVVFPPGTAKQLAAGSSIVLQMHYTPKGTAATDRTRVGLIFAKQPVKKRLLTAVAINRLFVIPPGNPNYEVTASTTFTEDVHLTGLTPHMHFRGKDFTYTAVYPDGRSEILLHVPRYDFGWQLSYRPKEPIALPKGARLECVAHFDNSPRNKANPDPTQEVRWGDQTWEEMMIGWFNYTRDADDASATTTAGR